MTGFDCYFLRNTGTYDTPTWVVMKEVSDVRVPDFTWGETQVKTRASFWVAFLKTMLTLGIEVDHLYKADPTNWEYLETKFLTRNDQTDFWIADGPPAAEGTSGPRFIGSIFSRTGNQELENVNMTTFGAKPTLAYDGDGVRIEPTIFTPNPPEEEP